MAIFQGPLDQPQNRMDVLRTPPVDTSLGDALTLAGKAIAGFAEYKYEQKTKQIQQNIETDIDNVVFNDSQLEQQTVAEIEQEQTALDLSKDPSLAGMVRDVNRIDQQEKQGRLPPGMKLDMLNALAKQYINIHPERTEEIRQHFSRVLGFSPEQSLIARALKADQEKDSFQKQMDEEQIKFAIQNGLGVTDVNDPVQRKLAIEYAQEVRALTRQTENMKLQAERQKLGGASGVTKEQQDQSMVQLSQAKWKASFGSSLALSSHLIVQAEQFEGGEEEVAGMRANLLGATNAFVAAERNNFINAGVSSTVYEPQLKAYQDETNNILSLMDAHVKERADMLNLLQNKIGIDARQAAGVLFAYKEAMGGQHLQSAAAFSTFLNDSTIQENLKSLSNALQNMGKPQVNHFVELMKMAQSDGRFDWRTLDPKEASKVINIALKEVKRYEADPANSDFKSKDAWSNLNIQLLAAGMTSQSPAEAQNAAAYLGTQSWRDMFTQVKDAEGMEDRAGVIADGARSVLTRNLMLNTGKLMTRIQEMGDFASVSFNPETGKYEYEIDLEGLQQRQRAGISERFGAGRVLDTTSLIKEVDVLTSSLNKSLDTFEHIKEFDQGFKDLEGRQLREIIASTVGIPMTVGARSSLPKMADRPRGEDAQILTARSNFTKEIDKNKKTLFQLQRNFGAVGIPATPNLPTLTYNIDTGEFE